MDFDWDPDTGEANWCNHGVSFEAAARVFLDVYRLEEGDPFPPEYRQRAIGMVEGEILFVVYTMRGDVCRIISARAAERRERRRYHEG